jgi:toxin ParE1/3/4
MPVIKRTAQAEEDMIDIWIYIAQDNPAAADRLFDKIDGKKKFWPIETALSSS